MKQILLLLTLLISFLGYAQTQIGQDIDGEATISNNIAGSVSTSGDGMVVAIGTAINNGNGENSGHVRVYQNINNVWTQIGADIDGEAPGDFLGDSVSISSDGSIVAIGAPLNDGNGSNSGQVRVYQNINNTWTQIGVDIDGEAAGDQFGRSVSISADGSIVAIGALRNGGNGIESGHVRVYQNVNGTWSQVGADIDGEAAFNSFGRSVSISADGSIVAIGADTNNANGTNSGHVRVFQNINGVWMQVGADIDGDELGDESGWSASLSADGSIVAIGAIGNDDNGFKSGQVSIFQNTNSVWTQIGSDINGEAAGDWFGWSVSISFDGSIVAIGSIFNEGNGDNSGHVRVYENINTIWTQVGADIDGAGAGDQSGWSVSLSSNGSIVSIFAPLSEGVNSGFVRVYDLSAFLDIEEQTISNFKLYPNPTKNQFTIQLGNALELENLNIYDNLGKLVLNSKEATIDTSKLASGLYVVEIQTNKGKGSKKLIIE